MIHIGIYVVENITFIKSYKVINIIKKIYLAILKIAFK